MTALLWLAKLPAPVRGLLGLAAAVLVGWAALAAHDRTQRAIGRAEAETARARHDAQRWQQVAATADARQARVDTVWRGAAARYAPLRQSITRQVAQLSAPYVDTAGTDTLRAQIIKDAAAALDAADTVIAACQLARLTCEQRVAARDSIIAALRSAVGAQTEAAPRPSLLARAGRAALWLGAGVVLDRVVLRGRP